MSQAIRQAIQAGISHQRAGRLAEAEAIYRQILSVNPAHPDALHLLGVLAGMNGHYTWAIDLIKQAILISPARYDYLGNLGMFLKKQGSNDEAIASYKRAITLKPDYVEGHFNLGLAQFEKQDRESAMASYQRVLAIQPKHFEALTNLSFTLLELGKFDDAVSYARQALSLKPDLREAHVNLGLALWSARQFADAITSYQQALKIKPDDADTLNSLGLAYHSNGQLDEAIASHRQALLFKPDNAKAHFHLGFALVENGELDEAIEHYRRAFEIDPALIQAHDNLLFAVNYHPASTMQSIYAECQRWNQLHAQPLRPLIQPHLNDRDPGRRLRIGYVSPDFKRHPVGRFVLSLLAQHDHDRFEIFCYDHVPIPDELTTELKLHADTWRKIVGLSDQEAADIIRRDRIDILVDLALHTADSRLLIFARRPAPMQVTFAGYPGTTGMDTIDYRITDPYLDPPGLFDEFYSEKSIRLPDTFWCTSLLPDEPKVNALPAIKNGYITFGCLNSTRKINDGLIQLWSKVLVAVPGSRLLLLAERESSRQRMEKQFAANGIAPERLEFISRQQRADYLLTYQQIDIALDPSPYGAHATGIDTLWMGIPTITLVGNTTFGRAGLSQMSNLGLTDLVAYQPEQYIQIAANLAGNLAWLAELRSTLRSRMKQSPLTDAPKFARAMEDIYRSTWRKWCEG